MAMDNDNDLNIQIWQLPRRFDAVVWYARWQHEHALDYSRLYIPTIGPSLAHVVVNASPEKDLLAATNNPFDKPWRLQRDTNAWYPHSDHIESFQAWKERRDLDVNNASVAWILTLPQEIWLPMAVALLDGSLASKNVYSSFVVLALGSGNQKLLSHIQEHHLDELHYQVYCEEMIRGLCWLKNKNVVEFKQWVALLKSKSWTPRILSRIPNSVHAELLEC
jgi:hypothetical protein